jgi:hypothetical protein
MVHWRRALPPVAAVWLACQIGTVALGPVALCLRADAHAEECTCGHGPDMTCPMHHPPAPGSGPCAFQAANDSGAAILTTLIGLTGFITDKTPAAQPDVPSPRVRLADGHLLGERPVPPDPPPPRA